MRVEAEAMRAFAEKWGLCAENDDAERFSPEERAQIELERQPVEEATESEGVTSMREFLRSRGAG